MFCIQKNGAILSVLVQTDNETISFVGETENPFLIDLDGWTSAVKYPVYVRRYKV